MSDTKKGRAWIELDVSALRRNVNALSGMLPPGCELMPAVKANAYGHGAVLIANELAAMGISSFCVATAKEGAELRCAGIEGDILVLGYTHPCELDTVVKYDLIQTAVSREHAESMSGFGRELRVHIAVDTGMHRIGERADEVERIASIFRMRGLRVEGMFTHLCADDTQKTSDIEFTMSQAEAFRRLKSELAARGIEPRAHILGSYGLLNYPELGGCYARVGIALYGVLSDREDRVEHMPTLSPVLSLKARVTAVKAVGRGEYVGYGLDYRAERDTAIAVLSIGYADGVPRALSDGRGGVLINGRYAPIAGRICMDQLMADIGDIGAASAGDEAVLIGKSGEREISVYDLARACGSISNEVLSRLGARLERVAVR